MADPILCFPRTVLLFLSMVASGMSALKVVNQRQKVRSGKINYDRTKFVTEK
jgi:hypothetical protein